LLGGAKEAAAGSGFQNLQVSPLPLEGAGGLWRNYRIQPVLTGIVYVLSAWAVLCLGWYGFLEQKAKKGGRRFVEEREKVT